MTKLTRTALAAFAAVGVIFATGATGVASAADTTLGTPSLEPSPETVQLSTTETRLPVVEDYTIAGVTAHSTGEKGAASDEECAKYADAINLYLGWGDESFDEGNPETAGYFYAVADELESDALGEGCFVIH